MFPLTVSSTSNTRKEPGQSFRNVFDVSLATGRPLVWRGRRTERSSLEARQPLQQQRTRRQPPCVGDDPAGHSTLAARRVEWGGDDSGVGEVVRQFV